MKYVLLFFLIAPTFLFAQNNKPIGDFCIENNAVVFRHIFMAPSDSAPALARKIMSYVSTRSGISNVVQNGLIITGNYDEIRGEVFTYRETKADFSIEIKNGKYRVTILNMLNNNNMNGALWSFNFMYIKDNGTDWRNDALSDLNDLGAFHKTFINVFTLNQKTDTSNW